MPSAIAVVATAVALLTLAGDPPPAMGADSGADQAAWVFDPDGVVEIDLGGLSQEEIEALEADPDEYQPGSFELRVEGTPQGPPLGEVGIRLKGGLGSFRPLSGKAAFKVKFDEYVDGQTFFGLEKLTLNNMVQDPSTVHEALAYEAFRAMGVAAPRTGYAQLRVGGEDYGLYLNVETLDSVALPLRFDSTLHLYEGAYGADLIPGGAGAFEVDEGSKASRVDLEALISAVSADGGDWSGVEALTDLRQLTRMWAVERYIGHWDGYAGRVEPADLTPNNYYLHSDAAGVFRMLPWGTDQTWIERLAFDQPSGGVLFNRCLAEESCEALYADALEELHATLGHLQLGRRAIELLGLTAPYRALEAEPRLEHSPAEIAVSIERTCRFVAERPGQLSAWLEAAGRVPASVPAEPSCAPASPGPVAPGPAEVAKSGPPNQGAWIGRSRIVGSRIVTSFALPGPGQVRQLAVAGLGGRRQTVCAATAEVAAAGALELRCRISRAARQQLKSGFLALTVSASFRPLGGDPDLRRRRIVARQRRA